MGARELGTLLEGGHYFESPRWHDGRWWVSDFYRHTVFTVEPDGSVEDILTLPDGGQPSGLGWLPDGTLLVVSMLDHRLLRRSRGGELGLYADVGGHCGGHLNDMVVAEDGTVYVGNFGFDLMAGEQAAATVLVRVDPDGNATVVADGLMFPNGSVVLDGTLVVAESFGHRLSAFDIAPDGSLSDRRDWVTFGDLPTSRDTGEMFGEITIAPDGIGADAEGAIWVADALNRRVVRTREGEGIVDEVSTGEQGAFACMLGGDDGRTLFICAAPGFAEADRIGATDAQLLAVRVDVPHGGLP
jgi:sugar lactone lactonase YvrE